LEFHFAFATRQVEAQPGFIVGPIAQLFGFLINILFNLIYAIGPAHSLGFAIILLTLIFRALMLPLSLKSQKSMMKMRELKPELDKIQEKYGKTKDPELIRKANAERQALMAKHGANPLSGCLPMLIQMPLFFGIAFIMRQTFLYINVLRNMYYDLSAALIRAPGILTRTGEGESAFEYFARQFIPNNIIQNNTQAWQILQARGLWYERTADQLNQVISEVGDVLFLGMPEHLSRVISRFNMEDWAYVYRYIPADHLPNIEYMVGNLRQIETFFGLHVVENGGWSWPGILIPVLVAVTMFMSSWLMQLRTFDPNADDRTKMTQKIMLFAMPLMMAFFTVNFPVGVGIFWISSQVFQVATDLVLLKKAGIKISLPGMKPADGK